MIFRNHYNMLICCSTNISDYYQCWKQLCCTIFLWKLWYILFFRIHRLIESSKEQRLFEIEICCNYLNLSLLIKNINVLTDPKWMVKFIAQTLQMKCVQAVIFENMTWRGSHFILGGLKDYVLSSKNKYNVFIVFILYCRTLLLLLRWIRVG